MTYQSPEWDPGDPDWATQEASTMDSRGRVHDLDEVIAGGRRFINLVSTSEQAADFTSDEYFHSALQARVNISRGKVGNSRRAIGHKLLQRLLEAPWKGRPSGVCELFPTHPFLVVFEQWIGNSSISDFGMMRLLTGCSQSISHAEGSSTHRSIPHPMKLNSDAHDLLSLLFQHDGVPPKMIMDGSKEQTLGRFKNKCQDADCRIKQTKPYSPWQNAAESAIRELKKATG